MPQIGGIVLKKNDFSVDPEKFEGLIPDTMCLKLKKYSYFDVVLTLDFNGERITNILCEVKDDGYQFADKVYEVFEKCIKSGNYSLKTGIVDEYFEFKPDIYGLKNFMKYEPREQKTFENYSEVFLENEKLKEVLNKIDFKNTPLNYYTHARTA